MKAKYTIIISSVIVLLVIGIAGFFVVHQKQQNNADKMAFIKLQKQSMQQELDNLHMEYQNQYDKLKISDGEQPMLASTDSLLNQLLVEKNRVDRLKEELNDIKSSSYAKIAKLSKEMGTLRTLLRTYIVQVDSLHTLNERLIAENKAVKASYNKVTQQAKLLKKEKENLTNKVNLAARLDAANITIRFLDSRGKTTSRIYRIKTIAVSFTIPRNVTASVGNKIIYARILDPNYNLLKSCDGSGTFHYENKDLPFSMRRQIEYNGKDTNVIMYWSVTESLISGQYRLSLFADSNLIGEKFFVISN